MATALRQLGHVVINVRDLDGIQMEAFYELPKEEWPQGDAIFGADRFPMTLEEAADVPIFHG